MATKWISPTWRMPEESNQSKFENYSLNFNGSDNRIQIPYTELNGSTNCTISFWAKINYAADSEAKFPLHLTSGTNNPILWIFPATGTALDIYIGNVNFRLDGSFNRDIAEWNHWVLRFDGSETSNNRTRVYQNGQQLTSQSGWGTATSIPTASHLILGGRNLNATQWYYQFPGDILDVSVFDYTLTEQQITSLYNSNTPINPMAITPAPITYYPLGGSSTGSSSTLTIPNESVPSATVFDFVPNDAIDISSDINITSNFSYSFWYRSEASSSGSYEFLLSRENAAASIKQFGIYNVFTSSGRVLANIYDSSGTAFGCDTGGGISENVWHHIAFCYSPSNYIRLYLDGVLEDENTTNIPSSIRSITGESTRIGGRRNNTMFLNGQMSNVQIWSGTLTDGGVSVGATAEGEVATLYNNGVPYTGIQPQAANLKGWWKMNVDTSTWNGSDWIIGNSTANYTTALDFPGGTDYIDFGTGFPTTLGASATAATASGWVKINDLTQKQALFNITTSGGNYFGSFAIWHDPTSNKLYAYINGNANNIYLSSGITDNNWHHLAVVYDQSAGATITDGLKLYLDGSPVTPTASAGSTPASVDFTASLITRLGWGWSNTFTAVADMSNWAMWNSALSPGNITTLYNDGTPETTISLSPTSYYKLDNITTGIEDAGSSSNNGTITGSITGVDSFVSTLNGLSDGMTTANLVTSDLTRSVPYSSYSMVFDGAADYIDFTEVDLGLNSTVSFWINPAVTLSSEVIIGSGGASSYFLYSQATLLYVKIGSYNNTFTHSMAANNWYNITIVRTGDSIEVFQNSTSLGTKTGYGTVNNTLFDAIGARANGNLPFEGKLSNVSGFNFALTEDQVLTIYNGGVPNDISSLSPVSWWSLAGDSYYDGTNWICPDLSTNSNNGTSSGMGGTELVGNGPGSTANGVATSMDIPANLKGNAPNSSKNAFSVNMNSADRLSGITNIPGTDSDVLSFLSAASITNATQQTAINDLVLGLKSNDIWDKMKVIYPFVGGTDVSHSYNLKDTTLAQITWTSGVTHSSDGVQGKYGDTGVTPDALGLGRNDASLGFYTQNGWQSNQSFPLGVFQGSDSLAFYKAGGIPGTIFIMINNYLTTVSTTMPANQAGFHQASRTLSTEVSYKKDNSTVVSISGNSALPPEAVHNLWINQANGYSVAYGGITSLVYFGLGLTDTQLEQMNTLTTAYQTTLGRQV